MLLTQSITNDAVISEFYYTKCWPTSLSNNNLKWLYFSFFLDKRNSKCQKIRLPQNPLQTNRKVRNTRTWMTGAGLLNVWTCRKRLVSKLTAHNVSWGFAYNLLVFRMNHTVWWIGRSLIKRQIEVYAKPPYTRWRVLLCCMWFPVVGWAYCCVKCMIPELLICPHCNFEFGKKTRSGQIHWTNKPAPLRSESPAFWRPECSDLNKPINQPLTLFPSIIFTALFLQQIEQRTRCNKYWVAIKFCKTVEASFILECVIKS